jgi:hypothetical protein
LRAGRRASGHGFSATTLVGPFAHPERLSGAVTKFVLSENDHEVAAILAELAGPDLAFLKRDGMLGNYMSFVDRALSIAGGTSEVKRKSDRRTYSRLTAQPFDEIGSGRHDDWDIYVSVTVGSSTSRLIVES